MRPFPVPLDIDKNRASVYSIPAAGRRYTHMTESTLSIAGLIALTLLVLIADDRRLAVAAV